MLVSSDSFALFVSPTALIFVSSEMDSFVAVVAVDGVNDAPFHLSAKFPVSRGYFVTVIPGSGGGFEPFHNDIERVESYKERKKAEEQIKPKYQR